MRVIYYILQKPKGAKGIMKKKLSRVISFLICLSMILSVVSCVKRQDQPTGGSDENYEDISEYIIEKNDVPYLIHYDEQTPFINDDSSAAFGESGKNVSWENWTLPLGNGYFGVNIFGRNRKNSDCR